MGEIIGSVLGILIIYIIAVICKSIKINSQTNQICEHCFNKVKLKMEDISDNCYTCPICGKKNNIVSAFL